MLHRAEAGGPLLYKITDFGLAILLADDDLTATVLGTPLYMAPEVLRSDASLFVGSLLVGGREKSRAGP